MRVKAIKLGFYGYERRRPGDVFEISGEEAFSEKWMERVDRNVPLKADQAERDRQVKAIVEEDKKKQAKEEHKRVVKEVNRNVI